MAIYIDLQCHHGYSYMVCHGLGCNYICSVTMIPVLQYIHVYKQRIASFTVLRAASSERCNYICSVTISVGNHIRGVYVPMYPAIIPIYPYYRTL